MIESIDNDLFNSRLEKVTIGITQKEISKKADVSEATLTRRLKNPGDTMKLNEIYRIAKTYGCSVDYLLGLSDNPGPRRSGSGPAAAAPGFDGFDGVPAPADLCALLSCLDRSRLARLGSLEEKEEAAFYSFSGFLDFAPVPDPDYMHIPIPGEKEFYVLSCNADFINDYIDEIRTGAGSVRMRMLEYINADPRDFIKKYAGSVNDEYYYQISRRAYIKAICHFCMVYDKSKSVFEVLPAPDAAALVSRLCELATDKYYNLVAAALFDGITEYAQGKAADQASE